MVMLLAMARKYDKYKDISYIRIIKMIIYEENNDNEDHEHENDENSYEEYIIITTDITIWLYTERARSFASPNFPKICHNFGTFTKTSSVFANTN